MMTYTNAAGDELRLTGLEQRRAELRVVLADKLAPQFCRSYEYWERQRAINDFETLVALIEGGAREEASVSGGDRRQRRARRVHHPRKVTAGRQREGAESGAA